MARERLAVCWLVLQRLPHIRLSTKANLRASAQAVYADRSIAITEL
jgi:hypothetical protein